MMTRLLLSSSLVLGGAAFVSAQQADQDPEFQHGQIRANETTPQQAGDRQRDQIRQHDQHQTGRDATGAQGWGRDQQRQTQQFDTKEVLQAFSSSNQLEIQLGELAQERARDPQVQQFARQMVEHHTRAQELVKQTAQQKGITLDERQLLDQDKAALEQMKQKQGDQFEAAYMFHQAGQHVQDVLMAQHVASSASDPQLQQLARQLLPALQQHLEQATGIAQGIAMPGQAQPAGAEIDGQQDQTTPSPAGMDQQDRSIRRFDRDRMQDRQNQGLQQQRDRMQDDATRPQFRDENDRTAPGATDRQ